MNNLRLVLAVDLVFLMVVDTYSGYCGAFGPAKTGEEYRTHYAQVCQVYDDVDSGLGGVLEYWNFPYAFTVSEDLKGDAASPSPMQVHPTPFLVVRLGAWIALYILIIRWLKGRLKAMSMNRELDVQNKQSTEN